MQSGTNNNSNNKNNYNNKNKTQNNFNSSSNNSNHNNIGSNTTNNISPSTTAVSNPMNLVNSNKKNDNNPINNKPQHLSSKMNNSPQPKSSPQPNLTNPQSSVIQTSQAQAQSNKQAQPDCFREVQSNKSSTKQIIHQQPQAVVQPPRHPPNPHFNRPAQSNQRRLQQSSIRQQSNQTPQQKQPQRTTLLNQDQSQAAVTFAHHIQVRDEDDIQYTFGFFDEQPNQTQQPKATVTSHTSNANNSRKQANQFQQPSLQEPKHKPKQSKASPNSEENCYKSNDNIDANSFNYEQILKFISNGR